jgi:hypothetical protein
VSACALARVAHVNWQGGNTLPSRASRPLAIAAGMTAGERLIPADVLSAAERLGAPLLLIAGEPLVRPHVELQAGRIIVLPPHATVTAIADRLLLLTADHEPEGGRPQRGSITSREYLRPRWWAAAFACNDDLSASMLVQPPHLGLTLVMKGTRPVEVSSIVGILLREQPDDERVRALLLAAGPDTGVVHLAEDGAGWLVHWPEATTSPWLFSPTRLPPAMRLVVPEGALLRLRSAPGDVMVLLSTPESPELTLEDRELREAAHVGGPTLLEAFSARFGADWKVHGLIVEVRG